MSCVENRSIQCWPGYGARELRRIRGFPRRHRPLLGTLPQYPAGRHRRPTVSLSDPLVGLRFGLKCLSVRTARESILRGYALWTSEYRLFVSSTREFRAHNHPRTSLACYQIRTEQSMSRAVGASVKAPDDRSSNDIRPWPWSKTCLRIPLIPRPGGKIACLVD